MLIAIHLLGGFCLLLLVLPALYVIILKVIPAKPAAFRDHDYSPFISVIIPAHNEEDSIVPKLDSLFQQSYPEDKIEIIVVDDGSTDNTPALLKKYGDRISVKRIFPGEGKIAALNLALKEARAEIIVITDADTELEKESLRALISPLQDPDLGAISGRLKIKGEGRSASYERAYVETEHGFRQKESLLSSVPFLFGQLSAFRKETISQIQSSAAVDDIEIALTIKELGLRVIHSEAAVVYETAPVSLRGLLDQKVRRGLCTIEVVLRHLNLLHLRSGLFSLTFFVRRVLPLFLPLIIIACYLYIWFLSGCWWVPVVLFGGLGIASWLRKRDLTEYMALMQVAICRAWWLYLNHKIPSGANWRSARPDSTLNSTGT